MDSSDTIYKILKIMFGWILQPAKIFDRVTEKHRKCHIAASGFTFVGEKVTVRSSEKSDQQNFGRDKEPAHSPHTGRN